MKTLLIAALLVASFSSFASATHFCLDIKFEAGSTLCRKQIAQIDQVRGTDKYAAMSFTLDRCVDDFLESCDKLKDMKTVCTELPLQNKDLICTLEVEASERAIGSKTERKSKRALKACRATFTKICTSNK
jgi:hypothetical protein